jgi:putative ABC transport system ATP-binding protein
MSPILSTEGITRIFEVGKEKIYALKNINISVETGSLTVLKGRSGSGKTTLVNLLGLLDHPDSGKIFFNGSDTSTLSESARDEQRRKNMGFVFQSIALVSHMSMYENVEFALRIAGFERKKMKERVEKCLAMVGLSKRMTHFPGELSGGEQQRVAIARAICHHPMILFADEPTADLDTHTGLQVMKIFQELVSSEQLTVVMSTHDPNMAEIADHVIALEDGEVSEQ